MASCAPIVNRRKLGRLTIGPQVANLPHSQKLATLKCPTMRKTFYGWWVTLAAFFTFGIAVGLPYYNMPFFYDYFQREFHWTKGQITFGFPLAAVLTLWIGPVLVPRFSPRKLILVGTALTCAAFLGFGTMRGSLTVYYALWFLYTVGYILSGPIPHQLIVSHWFRRNRGKAMGIVYVGVGLIGFLGNYMVKPLTEGTNFHTALIVWGALMFLAWPLAIFVIRDRPADKGLYPDGDRQPPAENQAESFSFSYLLHHYSFWLLLIGSFCSIGAIGAVNSHMKFVFLEQGFTDHTKKELALLNSTWRVAFMTILAASTAGRLVIGGLADRFSKKWVMTATYFLVAATIPMLLTVRPSRSPVAFAVLFGFGMGADYMLIPLMAAEQFGVNTLARAMAIILPVNTIGQAWFPFFVSILQEHFGSYAIALRAVFAVSIIGALAISLLPRHQAEDETLRLQDARRTAARG
jgi:MFS family permease